MADYKTLCAELADKLHDLTFNDESAEEDGTWDLIDRARAALAEGDGVSTDGES